MTRHLFTTRRQNSVSSIKDWYNKHKCMGLRTKNCVLRESINWHCSNSRVFVYVCHSLFQVYSLFKDLLFGVSWLILCMCYYFSIARNIVFVVIVISHDYSLPLSKLFCLKGSLNLKERRGDFLKVLLKVVRSKLFNTIESLFKVNEEHVQV